MADIYAAPILGPTQIYVGPILWLTFMQPQCWTHVVKIIICGGPILWLTYMQPQCWTHVLKIIICNTIENGYSEAHHILVVCVSQFWTHTLEIIILINATIVTLLVVKYVFLYMVALFYG